MLESQQIKQTQCDAHFKVVFLKKKENWSSSSSCRFTAQTSDETCDTLGVFFFPCGDLRPLFFCTLSSKVFEGWVMGEKKKKKESNGAHQQKKKNIGYGLVPLDRCQQETKEEEEPQVGSDKEEKWWAPVVSRSTSRLKQCELVTMIISDGVLGEGGGGWGCGGVWGGHTADRISYILCLLKFKTTKIWKLQFQTKQRKDV